MLKCVCVLRKKGKIVFANTTDTKIAFLNVDSEAVNERCLILCFVPVRTGHAISFVEVYAVNLVCRLRPGPANYQHNINNR